MTPLIVFGICSILYVLAATEACKPYIIPCRACHSQGWSAKYDAICEWCAGYGVRKIWP